MPRPAGLPEAPVSPAQEKPTPLVHFPEALAAPSQEDLTFFRDTLSDRFCSLQEELLRDIAALLGLEVPRADPEACSPWSSAAQGSPNALKAQQSLVEDQDGRWVEAVKAAPVDRTEVIERWGNLLMEVLDKQEALKDVRNSAVARFFDEPLVLQPHWMISDKKVCMRPQGGLGWLGQNGTGGLIGHVLSGDGCLDCLVSHPHGGRHIAWSLLGMAALFSDALTIPLQLLDMGSWTDFLWKMQTTILVYWILDVLVSCFWGFQTAEGLIEMRFKKVSVAYLATQFPFDITIIGVDVLLILVLDVTALKILKTVQKAVRIAHVLRLLRLVRLVRMNKTKLAMAWLAQFIPGIFALVLVRLFCSMLGILIVSHYIACYWLAIGDPRNLDPDFAQVTWVMAYGLDERDLIEQYTTALHWALTQFGPATNNIAPQRTEERAYAVCVVLFALVAFSSFISTLTNNVNQARAAFADMGAQEAVLRQFMFERGISTDLFIRTQQFFKHNFPRRQFRIIESDVKFFPQLPETFRVRFHAEAYLPCFQSHAVFAYFRSIDELLVVRVCHSAMSEKTYVAGQDVFIDGNEAHCAYYISIGQLNYNSIFDVDDHPIAAGDWISEMALWAQWVYRGHLCATTMCEIAILDELAFRQITTQQYNVCVDTMRRFAIFLLAYAQDLQDEGVAVTDLPVKREVSSALVTQAAKLSSLRVHVLDGFSG